MDSKKSIEKIPDEKQISAIGLPILNTIPIRRNNNEGSVNDPKSDIESFEIDPRTVIYPDIN